MSGGEPEADCSATPAPSLTSPSAPAPSARAGWLLTSRRHIDLLRVCSAR
ncbi:hypothetical protein ACWGJ2_33220 [Streptomyces sp. NPDC054796]